MRIVSASGIVVLLLCTAADARAEELRETVALRLSLAGARSVSPNTNVDLGQRFSLSAAARPWRLLQLEGDFGVVKHGGTAGLRAGFAFPLRDPAASFQLNAVIVAGYRAMEGLDQSSTTDESARPGLPTAGLLHVGEVKGALDATMWGSSGIGLTMRLFVGALVAPWAPYVGVAPEVGVAAGVAF